PRPRRPYPGGVVWSGSRADNPASHLTPPLNLSQFVAHKHWGRRYASPRRFSAHLLEIGESPRWLLASTPPNFDLLQPAINRTTRSYTCGNESIVACFQVVGISRRLEGHDPDGSCPSSLRVNTRGLPGDFHKGKKA